MRIKVSHLAVGAGAWVAGASAIAYRYISPTPTQRPPSSSSNDQTEPHSILTPTPTPTESKQQKHPHTRTKQVLFPISDRKPTIGENKQKKQRLGARMKQVPFLLISDKKHLTKVLSITTMKLARTSLSWDYYSCVDFSCETHVEKCWKRQRAVVAI